MTIVYYYSQNNQQIELNNAINTSSSINIPDKVKKDVSKTELKSNLNSNEAKIQINKAEPKISPKENLKRAPEIIIPSEIQGEDLEKVLEKIGLVKPPQEEMTQSDRSLEDDNGHAREGKRFDGTVKIMCNSFETDLDNPWEKIGLSEKQSSGFVIKFGDGNTYVLTNCHAVLDCVEDQNMEMNVFLLSKTRKTFQGKVTMMSKPCDLALIKLDEKGEKELSPYAYEFKDLSSSTIEEFGKMKFIDADVEVIGYPMGANSQFVTTGKVTSYMSVPYALSMTTGAVYSTSATAKPGNSGGPVYLADRKEDKLVGVIFEGSDCSNFIIPYEVVEHTLKLYTSLRKDNDNIVKITPMALNVDLQKIDSAVMRDYLGLDDAFKEHNIPTDNKLLGCLVKPTNIGLQAKNLQPYDIVIGINGLNLFSDMQLTINDIPLHYNAIEMFLSQSNPNVTFQVLRKSSGVSPPKKYDLLDVTFECGPSRELVQKCMLEQEEEYVFLLGVLMSPLTMRQVALDDQMQAINPQELMIFTNDQKMPGMRQAICLRKVMPIANLNMSFMPFQHDFIVKINQKKVGSILDLLYHVHNPVKKGGKEYIEFEFLSGNIAVLCHEGSIQELNQSLCSKLNVQTPFFSSELHDSIPKCADHIPTPSFASKDSLVCKTCDALLASFSLTEQGVCLKRVPLLEKAQKKDEIAFAKTPLVEGKSVVISL